MRGDVVGGRADGRPGTERRPVEQRARPAYPLLVLPGTGEGLVERGVRLLDPAQGVDRVVGTGLRLPAHLAGHRLGAGDAALETGRRHPGRCPLQQSPRLRQVRVRLRQRARQLAGRLRELLRPPVHGLDQLARLRQSALRRPHVHGCPGVVGGADGLVRLVEPRPGETQPVPGLFDAVPDGSGGGGGVPLAHHRERGLGRDQTAFEVVEGRPRGGEGLGCVLFQGAQPVEVLRLGVEAPVGLRAPGDDLVEHPPTGGVVLGMGVVELLAEPERGRQLAPCVLDRVPERLRRLVAELGGGEAEFLLAGAQCVVGVHERLLGPGVQLGQRHRGLRPVTPACPAALRRGAGGRAPAASDEGERPDRGRAADQDDRQDQVARARRTGSSGVGIARREGRRGHRPPVQDGAVSVRRADRRARPVVLPQRGLDGRARHVRELGVRQRGSGVDEVRVLPVVRGDGEQDVVLAEAVLLCGGLGPVLRGAAGEVPYVHDEELLSCRVVEPVESLDDRLLAVAERVHPVGDLAVAGQADGLVGQGVAGGGHGQPPRRHQHCQEHSGGYSRHMGRLCPVLSGRDRAGAHRA